MAHLFYNTLGNKGYCNPTTSTVSSCVSQTGYGLSNTGPFSNVQSGYYWSATAHTDTNYAWNFSFGTGDQGRAYKGTGSTNLLYVWAVHTGDVGASAVPVPAAAWLFGSGLLGLLGMSRKHRC